MLQVGPHRSTPLLPHCSLLIVYLRIRTHSPHPPPWPGHSLSFLTVVIRHVY